jgi:prevent-host-death family protein
MSTIANVTIEEAQSKLAKLIDDLRAGDEVIITKNNRPVARLVGTAEPGSKGRRLGTLRGTVTYMADDFDAPLDEFKEYMP